MTEDRLEGGTQPWTLSMCALCLEAGLTGIPVWPGTGRAQDEEEEDDEDIGQDGYDDEEEDEEEAASVAAGGGDRGDRPPLSLPRGSADRQAWCRSGRTWNDKQSLPGGRGRDGKGPDTQQPLASPPGCDPRRPPRVGSLEKEPLLGREAE